MNANWRRQDLMPVGLHTRRGRSTTSGHSWQEGFTHREACPAMSTDSFLRRRCLQIGGHRLESNYAPAGTCADGLVGRTDGAMPRSGRRRCRVRPLEHVAVFWEIVLLLLRRRRRRRRSLRIRAVRTCYR